MKTSTMKIKLVAVAVLLYSCAKKEDPFLITPTSIGKVTTTSTVQDLETIFAQDSIVKRIAGDEFTGNANEIEIFSKQGKALLSFEPAEEFDSLSVIKSVRVLDSQYKTSAGLNLSSTFKKIKDNYIISKITNTLGSVIITLNEINAFVVISKDQLPADLKFDTTSVIEAAQIPDNATIKYFWLDWNSIISK